MTLAAVVKIQLQSVSEHLAKKNIDISFGDDAIALLANKATILFLAPAHSSE